MKIKFENNANVFKKEMDSKVIKCLNAVGLKAVSIWQKVITAKKVVDTGRFRNSANYAVKPSEKKVILGSNVQYAPYLENGTSRQPARPTLKPTIMDYREDYEKLVEQILKG